MADRFTLPRLRAADAITDKDGRAVNAFVRFWDTVCRKIEGQETNQDAVLTDLQGIVAQLQAVAEATQQAQSAANEAQSAADGAAGGAVRSGSASNPAIDLPDNGWVAGPQVDLTTVTAGDLTITGSGPQQDSDVLLAGSGKGSEAGQFRILEIDGATETVVFTGSFQVGRFNVSEPTPTVSNASISDVADFRMSRTTTGDISYRIDARRTGSRIIESLLLYIYVRRS